ncbi:MAG: HAMP domain-containing sensor histidine kinase [Pirellulaceae bacterium]|nr:HAMP domain-containing histidine kinase [Planctomycetales bacterium]
MRYPIRWQLAWRLAVIVTAIVVAVTLFTAGLNARRARLRIQTQLQEMAATLADANFPLTDLVLGQMQGLSGATYVVARSSGEVIASSEPGWEQFSLGGTEERTVSVADGTIIPFEDQVRWRDVNYFHTQVRLARSAGSGAGAAVLHVMFPQEEYRNAWWSAIYPALGIGGVALALTTAGAWVVAARMTRPLERLQTQMQRIASGDFRPAEVPQQDDEVRELGLTANRMAATLAEFETQIRQTERMSILARIGGGLAHQMRNAATGCRIALDLHAAECPQGESEAIDVATRQLGLIEQYLQRFLALGKSPEGLDKRQVVEILPLIESTAPLLSPIARHLGIDLRIDARLETGESAVGMAPVRTPCRVKADADALVQIIVNLALNGIEAVGHLRAEVIHPQVCICIARGSPGMVQVDIRDNGPGPSEAMASRMFEAFATDKPDGVGLGLAVAHDLAQRSGGDLTWHRDDGWTHFTLSLCESPPPETKAR